MIGLFAVGTRLSMLVVPRILSGASLPDVWAAGKLLYGGSAGGALVIGDFSGLGCLSFCPPGLRFVPGSSYCVESAVGVAVFVFLLCNSDG